MKTRAGGKKIKFIFGFSEINLKNLLAGVIFW